MALTMAWLSGGGGPRNPQTTKAIIETATTLGTNQPDTLSASFWIGAR
jgi:hypothetical protein